MRWCFLFSVIQLDDSNQLNAALADPDLELREGRGGGDLLALIAFLPSVISPFFTQNKGAGSGPSARSATVGLRSFVAGTRVEVTVFNAYPFSSIRYLLALF